MKFLPNLVICGLVNIDLEIHEENTILKAGGNASHIAKALKMLNFKLYLKFNYIYI